MSLNHGLGPPALGIISWPAERDGGRPREGERRAQSRKGNKVFIENLKGNKVLLKMIKGIHQEFKSGTRYSNKEHGMVTNIMSLEKENLYSLTLSKEWFDQFWFFRLQEQMDQYKRAIDQLEVII